MSQQKARAITVAALANFDAAAFWGRCRRVNQCLEYPVKPWNARLKYHSPSVTVRGIGTVHVPRVAFALANGGLPPALFVCHTCDNPRCVEPLHLFLGTHEDNMQDAMRKGRLRSAKPPAPERKRGNAGRPPRLDVPIPQSLRVLEEVVGVRRARVFSGRYGLYGIPRQTLHDLACDEGVTRERVRQLILAAVRLLTPTG